MKTWKDVVGFEGLYEVSEDGEIKSLGRTKPTLRRGGGYTVMTYPPRTMKQTIDAQGYLRVMLTDEAGGHHCTHVHRIVCEAFHGPRPDGCEVAHGDGDKTNPAASNLRWATRLENVWDKDRHGTMLRGEENPYAKLTEDDIAAIRADVRTHRKVAEDFGISEGWAGAIRRKEAWTHV